MTATVARGVAGGPRPGRRLPPLLRQSAHHGLVLAAAALALLLAVTVLAALVAVAEQAAEAGARKRLAADPDAAVRISGAYDPEGVARADGAVRGALARTYGEVPHRTTRLLRAPAARELQLPVAGSGVGGRGAVGLSLLWAEDAGRQARLTEGEWPRAGAGEQVEVALDERYAARLGLTKGEDFALGGDEDAAVEGAAEGDGAAADEGEGADPAVQPLSMRVVGLYAPRDPDAPLWQDLTGTFGTPDSVGLVARRAFAEQPALADDATAVWLAVPDARRLRLGQVDPLRDRAAALATGDAERVVFGRAGTSARPAVLPGVEADTDLPYVLRQLDVPVAVARAGTYLPVALLASLALAALVLTARQLARHRAAEQVLLGSRGAGPVRLVGGAAAQWAAAALPAALAAPYLAGPLLRGLAAAGLLDGPVPASAATGAGWTVAGLALAVHAAAALTPVARAARDRRAVARLRRRMPRLAAYQRAGTDLALAGVAAVGWLQLVTYRTPVADSGTVDPVVVLAPVALTAATVLLALRLLPPAARAADRLARRSGGLVLPLGGWHLGRRAAGHAGPALLVALALAIAALGATALAVLDRGDRDQAAFAVGADLSVEAGQEGAGFVPRAERHTRYGRLPGVGAVTPVVDWDVTVGTSFAGMTALDSAEVLPTLRPGGGAVGGGDAGPVPAVRDGAGLPHDALAALGGTDPAPAHGLPLPGRPDALAMRVRLAADGPGTAEPFTLNVALEDADGLAHTVSGTLPPADGRAHRMSIPLGAYQYPLRLTGLQLRTEEETEQRTYRLTIDDVAGVPRGAGWRDLISGERPDRGLAGCPGRKPAPARGMPPRVATGFVLCEARDAPGALFDGVLRGPDTSLPEKLLSWQLQLGLAGQGEPRPVPVLATDALLDSGQAEVGRTLRAGLPGGTELRAEVVGSVDAVPGTDPRRGRLLVDTRVLAAYLVRAGLDPPVETHWWLAARDGDAAPARAAVERRPELGTARDVPGERAELAASPLREGTDGALRLCLVLAPAFAVVGFALHSVLAVRSRAREFALLRALGVRTRQLTALLWTEQLCLAAFAAAVGTATGVALAAAVVPAVTVTETGAAVHPELAVAVPWLRVAVVAAVVTLLICLAVTATARALARTDLARVLRAGDE